MNEVNAELAQVETIKRFALLPKELDQEDGEVTATQKVKRKAIETEFADAHRGDVPVIALLLADVTSTDLLRTLVSGLALGCKYALVALGFVIVFKAHRRHQLRPGQLRARRRLHDVQRQPTPGT